MRGALHAAFSSAGGATGTVATSRTFTRADSTPLRPSSKVTSVDELGKKRTIIQSLDQRGG